MWQKSLRRRLQAFPPSFLFKKINFKIRDFNPLVKLVLAGVKPTQFRRPCQPSNRKLGHDAMWQKSLRRRLQAFCALENYPFSS